MTGYCELGGAWYNKNVVMHAITNIPSMAPTKLQEITLSLFFIAALALSVLEFPTIFGGALKIFAERAFAADTAAPLLPGCKDLDVECYRKYYYDLALRSGTATAFADLKARLPDITSSTRRCCGIAANRSIQSLCHQAAHAIGKAARIRSSLTLGEILREGDPYCLSGYNHGVVVETLSSAISQAVKKNTSTKDAIRDTCLKLGAEFSGTSLITSEEKRGLALFCSAALGERKANEPVL